MAKAFKGYISIAADDLSSICTSVKWPRTVESQESQGINADSKAYEPTVKDGGDVSMEFMWDDGSNLFEHVFGNAVGTQVEAIYGPAGSGSAKHKETSQVLIVSVERGNSRGALTSASVTAKLTGTVVESTF